MAIYIQEQLNISTGAAPTAADTYRVPAEILYGNLKQIEDKLKSMGVDNVIRRVAYTDEELQQYLDKPPQGISEVQWQQAKKHNPDEQKLLPVPMMGFSQLSKTHTECQKEKKNVVRKWWLKMKSTMRGGNCCLTVCMHQRLQCEQQTLRLQAVQAKIQGS